MVRDFINPENDVGQPIPALTDHAVSVSLPTWESCVGYEEGEKWVVDKMQTGYPRFFIHLDIRKLTADIVKRFANSGETAMLFPSCITAQKCAEFVFRMSRNLSVKSVYVIQLSVLEDKNIIPKPHQFISPNLWACIFPEEQFRHAKDFWQHTGEGISSRRAEYCQAVFDAGHLVCKSRTNTVEESPCKGPRRYRGNSIVKDPLKEEKENCDNFLEERFGRNLNVLMAPQAKEAVKKRIAASIDSEKTTTEPNFNPENVYLYPCGMNAIFNTHQNLLSNFNQEKSICYGFPYVDTLKILEKWGPGCQFYGKTSEAELDELEKRLKDGERFLALFTEFPGNPVLTAPNLARIRKLADEYNFLVIVDETIGNFFNVNVLPFADILASSLTKIFSGDSNVMGGCVVLNPKGSHYDVLKKIWHQSYEDNYWSEDVVFLERNSRDFNTRADRINQNTENLCDMLKSHPKVKQVYYPKYNPSRPHYEACKTSHGGWGGLFSITFETKEDAIKFYNAIEVDKGPSLGTNFTLSSPYVLLAHYNELSWVESCGVPTDLVRFSVGLEDSQELIDRFSRALSRIV